MLPFRSRNWDQFEANKSLFGVETTFDEELYTTKLVRGPELREREREAQRIALEIVGQQTRNVHVAEVHSWKQNFLILTSGFTLSKFSLLFSFLK